MMVIVVTQASVSRDDEMDEQKLIGVLDGSMADSSSDVGQNGLNFWYSPKRN
jgi:hypothetical protein